MDIMLLAELSIVIILIISLGYNYWYKKKTKDILEELSLFKKEKEYYAEAIMVLSSDYDIIFANQAAKIIFSLDDKYKIKTKNSKTELRVGNAESEDFIEVLKKESEKFKNSFHLRNVMMMNAGTMKQVTIYVDKSAWNLNKTITCIIDMQITESVNNSTQQRDGKIDFFTGLSSLFSALTDINTLVMKNQQESGTFSLFLFGIDHFKELQSTLGLGFSNQIIRRMAKYFETKQEENIHVYRMDCDKFLLAIENLTEDKDIREIAKEMIHDIKLFYTKDSPVNISSSVGIVKYPQDGENALKLINNVYTTLLQAEKDSTSNIEFFTMEYETMNKDTIKMIEEIKNGLKNNEFLLYYQPIFSIKNENMIGAEALIRWKHPELGLLTADKFLNIVKQAGLMVDLGEYIFNEAMLQRKQWDSYGLKTFQITLNISLEELQVDTLIERLKRLFEKYSVNPREFNLDIVETTAMRHIEKTAIDLKLFKEFGLSVSLDHFAAENTSLRYLQMLPLSMVKIDRSLIFDLASNLNHQEIVKAIIVMAHSFNIEVVAEGVETAKELSFLYSFGCDYAQGYLYARPLPVHEFQELLG